ncbi:hypothetical protein NECAME_05357 [Necator americanus]|uniref:NTR domain-containing protein n=1 Tax=Necator americanus TaxID=51031 RepID=W2SHQ9_NECAM|nr:hypothetical protein NECAME_05357 [Necator americanus]ETN69140.1 hypothetical protein NECAME_05357 [Necator americanus]
MNIGLVSHVKVLYKMILPNNGLDDVLYIIQHIQTYKSSSGVHNMYSYVLTSSESSACGLVLDVGKEYLLSGTFYNGEYHTSTCFQVVTDDPADNFSGNLMEWKDVTSAFENRLHSFQC